MGMRSSGETGRARPAPRRRRARLPAAGLLALGLLAAGCAAEGRGEVFHTGDDQHRIANPSRRHGIATGIGCGFTLADARIAARRVSTYNLRSLTGPARYQVTYRVLREFSDEDRICLEMEARAAP